MSGKTQVIGINGAIPPDRNAPVGCAPDRFEADGGTVAENKHDVRQPVDAALRAAAEQRDARIRRSREATVALIEELTAGQEFAFEVNEFLHATWSSVLFRVHLAMGPDSNQWSNLARVGAALAWTLKPKHSEADRDKILKMIPSVLRALSRGMRLVNIEAEEQNQIFRMLAQQHALVVKLTARNIAAGRTAGGKAGEAGAAGTGVETHPLIEVEQAPANEVIENLEHFTRDAHGDASDISIEEAFAPLDESDPALQPAGGDDGTEQAGSIEIGSWIEFSDSPSRVLLARLSWKSKVSDNLVFVNRKGQQVRSMSVAELAGELHAGRATRVEASSIFDRAVFSIMNKLAG